MIYDLRHAFRSLLRRPGLSLAVLLILALGIGSTTTIFSVTNSVLLSAIPYKEGERLVALETLVEKDGSGFLVSNLDMESWRERCRTLELISAGAGASLNLTGGGGAERVGVRFVSAVFFSVVLLIGAGLMIKSMKELIENNPGFRVDHMLSARFELPLTQFKTDEPVYLL